MKKHSIWTMISYGFGTMLNEYLNVAFGMFVFYFYESELGLATWMVSGAFFLYALWNAVNDAFIGHLTNRPFPWMKKLGRRFPFIVVGGLGWVLTYILLFTPPVQDAQQFPYLVALWLVLTSVLYDTFSSLWGINFFSLFPEKFHPQERPRASSIDSIIGFFGVALGSIGPALLVTYGEPGSFLRQAVVLSLIGLVTLALSLKGSKDDPNSVIHYLNNYQKDDDSSFFATLKRALGYKNFRVLSLQFFLSQIQTGLLMASVPYLVRFILNDSAGNTTPIMAGFLVGALVSIPLWTRLFTKINDNRRSAIIVGFAQTVLILPIFFANSLLMAIIGTVLFGFAFGGNSVLNKLTFSDVIDETRLRGRREEGVYVGVKQFFGRLGMAVQGALLGLVHTLTGFVEGAATQDALAITGIRIHLSILPALAMFISTIVFILRYDLDREKVHSTRAALGLISVDSDR